MKKASFPHCVRERGIKQRYARFSAGGIALRWNSSTCCLKNSIVILPQMRGIVKYFLKIFIFLYFASLLGEPAAPKRRRRGFISSNQTPYFRVFRRMPGPIVVAMVALLK